MCSCFKRSLSTDFRWGAGRGVYADADAHGSPLWVVPARLNHPNLVYAWDFIECELILGLKLVEHESHFGRTPSFPIGMVKFQ